MSDPFRGSPTNEQFLREAKIGLFVIGLFICFFGYIIYVRIGQLDLQVPESVRDAPPSQLIDPELVRQKMYSKVSQDNEPPGQTMALGHPMPDDAPEPAINADSNNREPQSQVAVPENGAIEHVEPTRPPEFLPQSIHAAEPQNRNGSETSSAAPFDEIKSTVANLRESLNRARRQLPSSEAVVSDSQLATSPQTPARDQSQPPLHQSNVASALSEIPIREIQNQHGQPVTRDIADCPTGVPESQSDFSAFPLRSAEAGPSKAEKPGFQTESGAVALVNREVPADRLARDFPVTEVPYSQDFVLPSNPHSGAHVAPTQSRPARSGPVNSQLSDSLCDPDASNGMSEDSTTEDPMPVVSGAGGMAPSSSPSVRSRVGSRTEPGSNGEAESKAFQPRSSMQDSNLPQPKTARFGQHDSWWTVAERHYGDGRLFRALYAYNAALGGGPDDEGGIGPAEESGASGEADRIIQIPNLSQLISMVPDQIPADLRLASPPTAVATSGASGEHRSAADDMSTYRTRRGDTLFDIARRQLGQASRYVELYELNRDRLPDSCTHLSSLPDDMELRMPRR